MAKQRKVEHLSDDALSSERDPRISDIFYFFEELTSLSTGRTVGRKIGVVQEILLKKYLEAAPDLRRRMYLEQKLLGASGAAHKVEFSWYAVEPTGPLRPGKEILPGLVLKAISEQSDLVRVEGSWSNRPTTLRLGERTPSSTAFRGFLGAKRDVRLTSLGAGVAEFDIVDKTKLLASLESKRVGAQRFSGSSKLGSGIQTIEKAKQASLVAIDLDLAYNGNVKPLQGDGQKELLSLVALGNGVHWDKRDRSVLETYIDYVYLVRDKGIIEYVEYVRNTLGEDDFLEAFMDYFKGMTKQQPDDFEVVDDYFERIAPADDQRSLRKVLLDHINNVNG